MPVPKLLVTAALMAAQMALTATRKIEGPRLDDLKFTGGDYGAPLALVWGMRRLQVPIFWAEPLREVKRRRKTKGGKFNDYSYYGTWAVALAGHEIESVRRIWFDTHLVYDLSGAGPVTPFDLGDIGSIEDIIAIYLGTETQVADERISATVDAAQGAGSTPAYRGTAYVVFKDIPLEKLGNRIPQVSVEIVSSAATANLWPYQATGVNVTSLSVSPDSSYAVALTAAGNSFSYFDTAARAAMASGTRNPLPSGIRTQVSTASDGTFYGNSVSDNGIYQTGVSGVGTQVYLPANLYHPVKVLEIDGTTNICGAGDSGSRYFLNGVEGVPPASMTVRGFFTDLDGAIWATGYLNTTTAAFFRITDGPGSNYFTVPGLPAHGGGVDNPDGAVHYRVGATEHFVFFWEQKLYAASRATGAVSFSYTAFAVAAPDFDTIPPGVETFWAGTREFALANLSLVRAVPLTKWFGASATYNSITSYDPGNHALISIVGSELMWLYLDRVESNGVTLASVAGDVASLAGVVSHDFSALTQTVKGWSATRGQASNMLEPLLDAFDSDIRPNEFQVQGVKRAGVSGGTVLTERFVGSPRYTTKVRQSAELPRSLTVTFADVNAEQQPNTARVSRPLDATGAAGEQSIDLSTWATDVNEARQLTDRYFRRAWNERRELSLSLTAQQFALEPGDCRTLSLDGESDIYRCTSLRVQASGELATEWKYDHPSLAVLDGTTGAAFDGREDAGVVVPLLSKGFVLDTPYITDSDAQTPPIVYVAAAPYAAGTWPGAIIYQAVGTEYTEELAGIASGSQATWGYATNALANANPNVWDRGSSVNVALQVGTLTGTTEAATNSNPLANLALIGSEFVNFTTATLQGDGSYTLSGFKRGRRGTEYGCATHAARDVFLLLDTADDAALGLSEVGTNLSFKAITSGRTTGFPIAVAPYTGASLKPYAPCHLKAVKDAGTGDWALSWVRRTRVGGAWTGGTTIPISETTESYQVEIMNGAAVVRTITGLSAPTTTWTNAQQVTDFGSGQSTVTFRVYQISAAVSRGFVATATF